MAAGRADAVAKCGQDRWAVIPAEQHDEVVAALEPVSYAGGKAGLALAAHSVDEDSGVAFAP
jgi:hypothetical protein